MSIQQRESNGTQVVVATNCPLCGDEIAEQCSLAIHLRNDCDVNQDDEQTSIQEYDDEF